MFRYLVAKEAYGRKYKTKKDVIKGFTKGEDFIMIPGPYFSIRDKELLIKEYYTGIILPSEEGTIVFKLHSSIG